LSAQRQRLEEDKTHTIAQLSSEHTQELLKKDAAFQTMKEK